MFISLPSLALYSSLLLTVADNVPTLNVEPSCRTAAKMGDNMDATFQSCMKDEQSARAQLEAEWAQFSANSRAGCVANTKSGGGASYVDVLECVQMERDAAKLEKSGKQ